MDRVLIGVDAGTTNIKAAAFTLGGEELTKTVRETPLKTPRAGWVEQGMETTWERTAATIRETVDAVGDAAVLAVGVTGQGDGCWLIDGDGQPVRDAILWSDGRAADYVTAWKEDGTAERVRQITGSDLFPGAALSILQWLADNEPEAIDDAETAFFCKDWLKYRLTGERTMDYSGASLPFLEGRRNEPVARFTPRQLPSPRVQRCRRDSSRRRGGARRDPAERRPEHCRPRRRPTRWRWRGERGPG